jgi:hypothetical protein
MAERLSAANPRICLCFCPMLVQSASVSMFRRRDN